MKKASLRKSEQINIRISPALLMILRRLQRCTKLNATRVIESSLLKHAREFNLSSGEVK